MLVDVRAKLQRLSQVNSIQGGQQGVEHARGRETEPQAIEADQEATQVSDISPLSLVCTETCG